MTSPVLLVNKVPRDFTWDSVVGLQTRVATLSGSPFVRHGNVYGIKFAFSD